MNGKDSAAPSQNGGLLDPERAVNLLVCRPLGLVLSAAQTVPPLVGTIVTKGLEQLGTAPAKVRRVRNIGQLAVGVGGRRVRRIRRQVDSRLRSVGLVIGDPGERAAGPSGNGDRRASRPAASPPAAPARATTPGTHRARSSSAVGLAIPEYDGLSASQVVSRLAGLSPPELEAVRAYEAANRGRKTVLAAVDRLRR